MSTPGCSSTPGMFKIFRPATGAAIRWPIMRLIATDHTVLTFDPLKVYVELFHNHIACREMSLTELNNKYRKVTSLEKAGKGWEYEYKVSSKQVKLLCAVCRSQLVSSSCFSSLLWKLRCLLKFPWLVLDKNFFMIPYDSQCIHELKLTWSHYSVCMARIVRLETTVQLAEDCWKRMYYVASFFPFGELWRKPY